MNTQTIHLETRISPEQERAYFPLAFQVPAGVASMTITYHYPRRITTLAEGQGKVEERTLEVNIIDLGLSAPGNVHAGASGSDRDTITISPWYASPGYTPMEVTAGVWQIIIGAYRVQPGGVTVAYDITFTMKALQRFQGDTHMHTTASDGKLTSEELADLARKQGLDFIIITDHNNFAMNHHLPQRPDLTVIPGTEWTHYKGHSGFWGVKEPYRTPFCVNTPAEARAVIDEARGKGALIVVNHPFCKPECGWAWGFDLAPCDLVEVWNGPLMAQPENAACLAWWHGQLTEGKRIPVTGGSDFHRLGPMLLPGMPCTCVFAPSRSQGDILDALRQGNSYIKYAPDGPDMELDGATLGGTLPDGPFQVRFTRLKAGDQVRVITHQGVETHEADPQVTAMTLTVEEGDARFIRFEVVRQLLPNVPAIPVLVSNAMIR